MDRERFKRLISILESSGGKQLQHKPMSSGIHEGTKAMGEYGLMPNTAQQLARSNINKGQGTPLDEVIANIDPSQIEEVLKDNPAKYQEYIDRYADRSLNSSKNLSEAATRWLAGTNASDATMDRVQNKNPGRMKKIRQFVDNPKPVPPMTVEDLLPKEESEVLMSKIRGK